MQALLAMHELINVNLLCFPPQVILMFFLYRNQNLVAANYL